MTVIRQNNRLISVSRAITNHPHAPSPWFSPHERQGPLLGHSVRRSASRHECSTKPTEGLNSTDPPRQRPSAAEGTDCVTAHCVTAMCFLDFILAGSTPGDFDSFEVGVNLG